MRAHRVGRVLAVLLLACVFSLPSMGTSTAWAATGPTLLEPAPGASLSVAAPMTFTAAPMEGAEGYLWGFFRNGTALWENYANERTLSGPEYRIDPGSPAASAIGTGPLQVWVRALIRSEWTDATTRDVQVVAASGGPAACRTINFLGLRGSGERAYQESNTLPETNMGALVGDTYGQFVSRANSVGIKVVPDAITDYPAVPFVDIVKEDLVTEGARHLLLDKEFAGVVTGADALQQVVAKYRATDPNACFVLSGYSQGAWVIGEFLARPAGRSLVDSDRLAAVVLYADPLFQPGHPESRGEDHPGIARALGVSQVGSSGYIPPKLAGKVLSICLPGDFVCNFRWPSLAALRAAAANVACLGSAPVSLICPHYDYRYSTSHLPVSDDGTAFLARTVLGM